MGKIEDAILENYKKSLQEGNLNQAKISVNLAKTLKELVENTGFIDFETENSTFKSPIFGDFFHPFPYRYYPHEGVVVISNTAINLTKTENNLFYFFSQNETCGEMVKVITREQIREFLWAKRKVTRNAIRIIVKRLRIKIEPNPSSPQIILSYNRKGYIFVGKRVNEIEE
jgi:DNA-binding winged helix-turn-helix (wHTH) protein